MVFLSIDLDQIDTYGDRDVQLTISLGKKVSSPQPEKESFKAVLVQKYSDFMCLTRWGSITPIAFIST
jgi:hypothetical protein